MTSERWTKVKAGSIDRWTCVDSGTSQRARSNRPLPVSFHLSRHSNVSTCHASSTSQEHLISFDPACPLLGTRDELPTLVNRVNETSWIGCIEARLNVVPWLTNHNTRVPREIQCQLTNIVQTSMLDYSRDWEIDMVTLLLYYRFWLIEIFDLEKKYPRSVRAPYSIVWFIFSIVSILIVIEETYYSWNKDVSVRESTDLLRNFAEILK